jgi:hypothetical protein
MAEKNGEGQLTNTEAEPIMKQILIALFRTRPYRPLKKAPLNELMPQFQTALCSYAVVSPSRNP